MSTAVPVGPALAGPHVRRLISSDSVPAGGFTPGTILLGRYRIIGLLGRGGMGDVYRADDLKLGQAVALKFLPPALAEDPVRRERLFAEVRIARQVSHPNICRVYDIAELEEPSGSRTSGRRYFLTMEYIDGEDLASLLQRIGYLTNEKALDLARQLVAGLAAAHERGVLHRDLKPANIMVDGRGRVRITDFGLAIAASDEAQAMDAAGTPAYMAPEQLAGKGATVRSDIYALGLVLYELYTGKRAFTAATLPELRQQKEGGVPTAPSEFRPAVDPVVERVVMRCLERDPRSRPASATHVAAALPGGDPLAAAIAAGETPSPEMVAASGLKQGLQPVVAVALLGVLVLAFVATAFLDRQQSVLLRLAPGPPPAALVERARDIIRKAGYTGTPADSAFGFEYDARIDTYLREANKTPTRYEKLEAYAPLTFWYRQSPVPLERRRTLPVDFPPRVTLSDPPMQFQGEIALELDLQARLRRLEAVPERVKSADTSRDAEWTLLFSAADLDSSAWRPAAPQWNPLHFADTQVAWTGVLAGSPDVRIEAAAYGGRPVSFQIIAPWTGQLSQTFLPTVWAVPAVLLVALGGGVFFARRNVRLGRGDRRGAARLVSCVLLLHLVTWVLTEHHVPTIREFGLFLSALGIGLVYAGGIGVLYLALEPFVRRRWPEMLVTWTRVLSGDWRDPLVGRDLLVGAAGGAVVGCLLRMEVVAPSWLDFPPGPLIGSALTGVTGPLSFLATLAFSATFGLAEALVFLFLFFLLRLLLRNEWVTLVVWVFLLSLLAFPSEAIAIRLAIRTVEYLLFYVLIRRFGLGAVVVGGFVIVALSNFPITFDTGAWYAGYGYAALAVVAVIALYGFRTSLAGRRVFEFADA